MKLRTVASVTLGAIGATALGNRLLAHRAGDLEPALRGSDDVYRWRGFDVAYTEAGDPDDPDLLLVHGISAASSGREFAEVFEALSADYHVVAPDLPGFGRSDRPPLLYSASLYETLIADAITDLVEEPTVVASSLSGAYVAGAAGETDVESLVLLCPTDETMGDPPRAWLRALLRSPVVGSGLFNLIVSESGLQHFHRDHGYADIGNLTDETLEYEWTSAHQPGARYAPASFLGGFLDPDDDLERTLADLDVPVTLIWGREADTTPVSTGRQLAEAADARLVVFDDAKLLPHVEHPAAFVDVVIGEFEEGDVTTLESD
ncbi:alpha/beta fold hydrolase [Halorhabdus amylolytica]|uniref:alpha/beta fold hydrolase n=1 Tax=Halorhabdus amylolytica TaxID=2559573 RepID=UPI0010AABFF0|nr:alpha/beta hydrolase [Halorhabdus amylolytica]